jgi:hypothetical protein
MSQHLFTIEHEGRPIRILMGWDRPLKEFFLSVARLDVKDDEDSILYASLYDMEKDPRDIDYLVGKLEALGIKVPDSMISQVRTDAIDNVGNKLVNHTGDAVPDDAPDSQAPR